MDPKYWQKHLSLYESYRIILKYYHCKYFPWYSVFPCIPYPVFPMVFSIQYFYVSRIQYFPWYSVFRIPMYSVSSISHGIQFSVFPCIPYPVSIFHIPVTCKSLHPNISPVQNIIIIFFCNKMKKYF